MPLFALVTWTLLAVAAPGVARAEDDDSEKRAVPDYDGRGGPPTTARDVLLWPLRIALFPAYLLTEYVIRRPLGAFVMFAERANLPKVLYDFFTFGPDHNAGFAPIAFVDFGFKPSVGLYLFWNDAFAKGHDMRLKGSTWGEDWLAGSFIDRIRFGEKNTAEFRVSAIRRPDYAFFGLGSNSLQGDLARYSADTLEASAATDIQLLPMTRVQTKIGVRSMHFSRGQDTSVEDRVASGLYALPPGFARGYTAEYNRLALSFDTRKDSRKGGVRAEIEGEQGNDVRHSPGASWMRYGATVGGFMDLYGKGRVLSLSLNTSFADPIGNAPVPFTELVTLGGAGPMRGFLPGRLRDRSAAVATARYRWPIWAFADGSISTSVGNVFDEHLQDFEASHLRLSGALGIETVGSDGSFEFLLGAGTETFEHGAQVDSIRLVVGTNHGF